MSVLAPSLLDPRLEDQVPFLLLSPIPPLALLRGEPPRLLLPGFKPRGPLELLPQRAQDLIRVVAAQVGQILVPPLAPTLELPVRARQPLRGQQAADLVVVSHLRHRLALLAFVRLD